jgi:hypothetical protein
LLLDIEGNKAPEPVVTVIVVLEVVIDDASAAEALLVKSNPGISVP